mgnify:CR=1 FL=1
MNKTSNIKKIPNYLLGIEFFITSWRFRKATDTTSLSSKENTPLICENRSAECIANNTSGEVLIEEFATNAGDPGLDELPVGECAG